MLRRQNSQARAVTAAARRIDPSSEQDAREQRLRVKDWQTRAWTNYDTVGEVRFASRYKSDGLAKLRLFAATRKDPEQPPINVTDEDAGVDKAIQTACLAAVNRLKGTEGDHAELLRSSGLCIDVAGEGVLLGAVLPHLDTERETWRVYSTDEFVADPARTGTRFALKSEPDARSDQLIDVPPEAFVLRIWRQHPRWSNWADSAMRAANGICEELHILTQMIHATAKSRIPAGILKVPNELDFGQDVTEEGEAITLLDQLLEHMGKAVNDSAAATRLVPLLISGPGEQLKNLDKIEFSRELDRLAIELRDEARRAFAAMVDMPPEVLTGKVDLNHWNAWSVKEDADREVLSLAELVLPSITRGYLVPTLNAMGVKDPSRFFLWYDDSELTSKPNEGERYERAYDRAEVQGVAYTRALGIPDEDRPDAAEVDRILMIKERLRGKAEVSTTNGPIREGAPATAPPGTQVTDAAVAASAVETEAVELPTIGDLATIAAVRPVGNVGRTLADLERGLRARVQTAADAAMRHRLERIGNALRNQARKTPALAQVVEGVPSIEVAALLGPAVVAEMGDANQPDAVLVGAFDEVRARFELWVAAAQRTAAREVVKRGPRQPDERELDRLDRVMTAHRLEGWKVLEVGLLSAAAARVFSPSPEVPARGEFDASFLIPAGTVRQALEVAGGGKRPGTPTGGALLGEDLYDFAAVSGLELGDRFEWVHGDADRPFEPHLELSGDEFNGWTDEKLDASAEGWLAADFYYPGDHDGCSCEAVPFYTQASEHVSTGGRGDAAAVSATGKRKGKS